VKSCLILDTLPVFVKKRYCRSGWAKKNCWTNWSYRQILMDFTDIFHKVV